MGLLVSGEIDGNIYENKRMGFDQVLNLFPEAKGMFDFLDKKSRNPIIEFAYDDSKVSIKNGMKVNPAGCTVPNTIKTSYKGAIIEVTYFTTMKKDKNGEITTLPRKLGMGKTLQRAFNWQRSKEEILFMALHPFNSGSVLRAKNDNRPRYWKMVNKAADSQKFLEQATLELSIRNQIMVGDIDLVKTRAKGMGIAGGKLKDTEVRHKLIQMFDSFKARNRLQEFVDKYNKPVTMVSGSIQELIDRGFVVPKKNTSGTTWTWRSGLSEHGAIVTVPKGQEANEYLKSFMVENLARYGSSIKRFLSDARTDERFDVKEFAEDIVSMNSVREVVQNASLEEMSNQDLVDAMKLKDLIGFNPETKAVHFYNKKEYGKFLKSSIFEVDVPAEWTTELAVALEENKNTELLISLRKAFDEFRKRK